MIEWIVSSSVLIVAILILRRIFRDKVSKRLQYALWVLVLLRLLIPGSLVESAASVGNLLSDFQEQPVIQNVIRHNRKTGFLQLTLFPVKEPVYIVFSCRKQLHGPVGVKVTGFEQLIFQGH